MKLLIIGQHANYIPSVFFFEVILFSGSLVILASYSRTMRILIRPYFKMLSRSYLSKKLRTCNLFVVALKSLWMIEVTLSLRG